jgi:hypothetical protein
MRLPADSPPSSSKLELVPFDFVREVKDWFDYSLKGLDNGWDRRPSVRAYVL